MASDERDHFDPPDPKAAAQRLGKTPSPARERSRRSLLGTPAPVRRPNEGDTQPTLIPTPPPVPIAQPTAAPQPPPAPPPVVEAAPVVDPPPVVEPPPVVDPPVPMHTQSVPVRRTNSAWDPSEDTDPDGDPTVLAQSALVVPDTIEEDPPEDAPQALSPMLLGALAVGVVGVVGGIVLLIMSGTLFGFAATSHFTNPPPIAATPAPVAPAPIAPPVLEALPPEVPPEVTPDAPASPPPLTPPRTPSPKAPAKPATNTAPTTPDSPWGPLPDQPATATPDGSPWDAPK